MDGIKISVRVLNDDFSRDILECAFDTRGRVYKGETLNESSLMKWLLMEHSPVEVALLKIKASNVSKSVISHIVRHTKGHPRFFVETSRPDKTGEERNLSKKITFSMVANPLALMNMFRQRLCNESEKDTVDFFKNLKKVMMNDDNVLVRCVGKAMIPDCFYRFSCNQISDCGNVFMCPPDTSMNKRIEVYNNLLNIGSV